MSSNVPFQSELYVSELKKMTVSELKKMTLAGPFLCTLPNIL